MINAQIRKERQVSYPALTLFYMTGEGEREVFFFTIEAAARTIQRLHELGLKVSLNFKGEVNLERGALLANVERRAL